MVECPGYNKYTIRMDGSGNVTDRNRKYLRAFTPDHKINPPSPHRPCMEQPKILEAAVPSPVEGTLSTEEAPPTAAQEDHVPEAPQVLTYADVAAAPPNPDPEEAAPQPATGDLIGAGSTPRRSARVSRPPKRYIAEC